MKEIDHIGIAVSDMQQAIKLYQSFGLKKGHEELVSSQKTHIVFMDPDSANCKIELLAPIDGQGPVAKFLEKRGPGQHHICFLSQNIVQDLEKFKKMGFELIDTSPRPGAHNSLVAFIHPKSCEGVLIELCQLGL